MELAMPAWTSEWFGPVASSHTIEGQRSVARVDIGQRFRRATCRVSGARKLDDDALQAATCEAYLMLQEVLDGHVPVRMWNGLPGILDDASHHRDRYMVFNAGRHDAFDVWFRDTVGIDDFGAAMPAASGVGHTADDLVIHVLADKRAGKSVENPRQCPAFRYSSRYGPRTPCFSRGMLVDAPAGQRHLMISGTASIVGEDSVHIGDVSAQLDETLENIEALIKAAGGEGMSALRNLRVYCTQAADCESLAPLVQSRTKALALSIEYCPVVLCRADLVVEIEGLARLRM